MTPGSVQPGIGAADSAAIPHHMVGGTVAGDKADQQIRAAIAPASGQSVAHGHEGGARAGG